ncbi:MAG: lysozyme [Bacteroidales bacterium]
MEMKISKDGIALIKKFEGCRLEAYRCSAGVWTIGYGHTGKEVKPGVVISQQQAEEWLLVDCNRVLMMLRKALRVPLKQNQLDALVSLGFNIGAEALRKSTLMILVNRDPNERGIPDQFDRWVYADGKMVNGLVRRRKAERELYAKR